MPKEFQEEVARALKSKRPPPRWKVFHDESGRPFAAIQSRAWYEWHRHHGKLRDAERNAMTAKLRRKVIARDGYVCGICKDPVEPRDVHIDHIVPISSGGRTEIDNLQVAHSSCNLRKGASSGGDPCRG